MNCKYFVIFLAIVLKFSKAATTDTQDCSSNSCLVSQEPSGPTPISEGGCCCSGVFVNTYKLRVVFDWWLCEKTWQYVLTLVGLFGFAMMSPCLKAYREILRTKAMRSYVFDCLLTHFVLFLFALSVYVLDFLLMLIVMSFNVGVFFAVTSGYAIGYVLSSMAYASFRHSSRGSSFCRANEDCC